MENNKIKNVNICNEMQDSFLDYAMSVIVSRALPDARDGLKPVHRRILYAMNQSLNHADKSYQKSARTVGEVMGKYHPHGDNSIYDAMVRMAQTFSYRYKLVDGHGNFGSVDGDKAAAMRYTEARMSKLAMFMLKDINKKTIDFQDNYDGKEQEPTVLPAKFPNLLVNGTTGIAVGMATNIPPHNLNEIIAGVFALMVTIPELMTIIKGPDFPTGGTILGQKGIENAYTTGKGSIVTRSKVQIQQNSNGKSTIIVSEIPFQINKAKLIMAIAHLVKEKTIEGISDLRDETNRKGMRIVIELKRNVVPQIILNKLYKNTSLQASFSFNNVVLVKGQPKRLNLKETLEIYLEHQIEIITRRTKFDLQKARDRINILQGLSIALQNIDEVVEIIKSASDVENAKQKLISKYALNEIQAKAILDMKLARLTGLERIKIEEEIKQLKATIADFEDILARKERVITIIKEELEEIKGKFGDERKTIIDSTTPLTIDDEDLIPQRQIVVTLSATGYIKRINADTYKSQNRGGKGIKGQSVFEEDIISKMIYCSTHTDLIFFTNKGKGYRVRAHTIPQFARQAKGLPIINLLDIEKGEKVQAILQVDNYHENQFFIFATVKGTVKKTAASKYKKVRKTGKIAIALREGDELLDVIISKGTDDVVLGNEYGKLIKFNETNIRSTARKSFGVRGMKIDKGHLISIANASNCKYLLSISNKGTGKMTPIDAYRQTKRAGKGVKTIKINHKTGKLVSVVPLTGNEELLLITTKGQIIRLEAAKISVLSRNTQGVRLMNIDSKVKISSVVPIIRELETKDEVKETI